MAIVAYIKTLPVMHMIIGIVFLLSGFILNFLQLCSCILWPFNRTLYRRINICLAYSSWSQLTFLGQWWSGSNCIVRTNPDDIKYYGKENAIVIMNHKYDIDWLMGWIISERLAILGATKVYAKNILRYVPIIGWAWIFTETIFLKRNWEKDRHQIVKDCNNLADYPEKYWVLMFLEGTRFTEEKRLESMKVARQKGLPELKHHILPRTKGFILTAHGMKDKVDAVYDVTIGFKSNGVTPTLNNVINGKACQAEVNVRRIPFSEIPTDSDEAISNWVHKLYREKDEKYEEFVQQGHFSGFSYDIPYRYHDLINWLCWMLLFCLLWTYYLFQLIIYGSFSTKMVIIIIIVILVVIFRQMISVTETEKGSSYGKND